MNSKDRAALEAVLEEGRRDVLVQDEGTDSRPAAQVIVLPVRRKERPECVKSP